jgi:hypothetical protein
MPLRQCLGLHEAGPYDLPYNTEPAMILHNDCINSDPPFQSLKYTLPVLCHHI